MVRARSRFLEPLAFRAGSCREGDHLSPAIRGRATPLFLRRHTRCEHAHVRTRTGPFFVECLKRARLTHSDAHHIRLVCLGNGALPFHLLSAVDHSSYGMHLSSRVQSIVKQLAAGVVRDPKVSRGRQRGIGS